VLQVDGCVSRMLTSQMQNEDGSWQAAMTATCKLTG
jgi:hypothetical protein